MPPPSYSTAGLAVDFIFTLLVLITGFVILWVFCKVFRIKRLGIPEFGAIILVFATSAYDLKAMLWAVVSFIVGFISGRSTRILLNPTDITSYSMKLSDEEYAFRAEQYREAMKSADVQQYLLSPYHDVTEKLTLLFEGQGFGLYRNARILALLTSLFYFTVWSLASNMYSTEFYLLLCLLSLPFGHVMGLLWKYIKGHPGEPKIEIGGTTCKPTMRSFILSFLYDLTPAIIGGIVHYFLYSKSPSFALVLDVIAGLFCISLVVPTIFVHLRKISWFEDGIVISGIGHPYGFHWTYIEKAEIRERHNLFTGTDKLLILYVRQGHRLVYPVSILSKACQNEILREVRKRVPTSSVFDKPSL